MNKEVKALFHPRLPPRFVPPIDIAPEIRRTPPISGVASLLSSVQLYKDQCTYSHSKSELQKRRDLKNAKVAANEELLRKNFLSWSSRNYDTIAEDPRCTLFVGRLRYVIEEDDLSNHFAKHGKIRKVTIVREQGSNKSRGYAFIVFESQSDMRAALHSENGALIKGRRIITDTERSRLQKSWKPRRLGGGKGGRQGMKHQLAELARKRPHGGTMPGRVEKRRHGQAAGYQKEYRTNNRDMPRTMAGSNNHSNTHSRGYGSNNSTSRRSDNSRGSRDSRESFASRDFRDSRQSRPSGTNRNEDRMDPRSLNPNGTSLNRRVQQTQAPLSNSLPADPRAGGRTLRKY